MHRLAPGCKYDYHLNASLDLHNRVKDEHQERYTERKECLSHPPIGVPYFYRGFASDT